MNLSMTVGRDYRTSSRYEYVIYEGEEAVAREGFFSSSTQARGLVRRRLRRSALSVIAMSLKRHGCWHKEH
jgi:hypothetical protein